MNDAVRQMREEQARGDWDLPPGALKWLLLQQRVVVEDAPRSELQRRLDERLRDKAYRCRHRGDEGWPRSVSDRWLQQEIDFLTAAIHA